MCRRQSYYQAVSMANLFAIYLLCFHEVAHVEQMLSRRQVQGSQPSLPPLVWRASVT